jgi:hypothetical protein
MGKLLFNATKQQILKAAALAFNESESAGMGLLHYRPEVTATPGSMEPYWINGELHCDWVQGRCMKFAVWKPYDPEMRRDWQWMTGLETQDQYETWRTKYPTYVELLQAAGIHEMMVVPTK